MKNKRIKAMAVILSAGMALGRNGIGNEWNVSKGIR